MMDVLLLISGPLAVGKSAVADVLSKEHRFKKVSSGNYLKALAEAQGLGTSRSALQALGDALDERTDYRWLIDEVAAPAIADSPMQRRWFIDAVRKHRQVQHFRERFGDSVFHVHLAADEAVLEGRYSGRMKQNGEYEGNTPYAVAREHANEIAARSLIDIADLVVRLDNMDSHEAVSVILGERG